MMNKAGSMILSDKEHIINLYRRYVNRRATEQEAEAHYIGNFESLETFIYFIQPSKGRTWKSFLRLRETRKKFCWICNTDRKNGSLQYICYQVPVEFQKQRLRY